MSLGEAFIEVRADLRPFGRDLRRNVKPIVEAFEKELSGAIGKVALKSSEEDGEKIGSGLTRGMKKSLIAQMGNKNAFIVIASALAGALDDGISALPTEVKAAIVAGILLATPILAAFLTGALTAAIGASFAVLGVALASQFKEVQLAAVETGRNIREILTVSAMAFGPAIINALALVESRFRDMQGLLGEIFTLSAGFVEPLIHGVLQGLQEFFEHIRKAMGDLRPFVDELGVSITILFDAIGKAIRILAASGDDGVTALRDLAALMAALILATTAALVIFTKFYGVIRDVVSFIERYTGGLSLPIIVLARFFEMIDDRSNRQRSFINSNDELGDSFKGLIDPTEAETQELKKFSDALEKASDSVKTQLNLNISWEESLDRIAESIEENGKTLDIRNEKGRANAREFARALENAEDRIILMLQRGQISSEEAVAQYNAQTEALRQMAVKAGIGEQQFNDLFNQIIETGRLRISSEEMGIDSLTGELGKSAGQAQKLYQTLRLISHLSSTIGRGALGGVQGFAEGGFHFLPNIVRVAEDGPEVTIPLTKPARAAQLLDQSGLSKMLNAGPAQIMVFIGNEQLDARMVRIVETSNRRQALALTHGGRTL